MRKTEKLRNENEDLRKEKRKLQHDLAYEVEQNKYLRSHMDMLQQTASTHKQLVELYNRQLAQLKGARPDESVPIGNWVLIFCNIVVWRICKRHSRPEISVYMLSYPFCINNVTLTSPLLSSSNSSLSRRDGGRGRAPPICCGLHTWAQD